MSLTSYRAAPPRDNRLVRSPPGRLFLYLDASGCALRWGRPLHPAASEDEWTWCERASAELDRPGSDLLSRVLRHSTIGAEGFHGRVRDGIGCLLPRHNHQANQAP